MKSVRAGVVLLAGLVLAGFAHPKKREDVYDQIGVLKGQVFVANNPDLGRTPASGQYFVVQRTGCRECLVGVRADIEGRYEVYLGIGKYRIICVDPDGGGEDIIRKGQAREVTVREPPNDTQLNIDLEIPRPN